ncbi:MAG: outer membrane protein assembly factor BamB family protein [Pirellulales bacterium]
MTRRVSLLAVAVCLLAPAARGGQGDWTRFRGPNGAGASDAKTVPVQWTENDYNWKVEVPGVGRSSPVLWENRIYLTSADSETAGRTVLCLDTSDGRTLWRRDYPSKTYRQHGDNSYASATPSADALGVVVTWTAPDEVVLLALSPDGRDVWRRNLGSYIGERGSGTSPIIVGDLVVLANDQEDPNQLPENAGKPANRSVGKSFLIAVDRRTGETRWQIERRTGYGSYATPCLRQNDGKTELVFASMAHGLTGVDPATGKITWEMKEALPSRSVGSPVLAGDLVLAGYGAGVRGDRFVAVRPGSREKGIEPTLACEVTRSAPLVPTPLVHGDRLYLFCDDGVASCLNAATGQEIWRGRAGGWFFSSPVCVEGRIYAVTKSGEVVVLAAADKFEVLARVPLGEPTYATPAVSGGVMYFRTNGHLFSLGGKHT